MLLGVGLLMFPLVMLVAAIPTWIEAKSMGELAAPGGSAGDGPCQTAMPRALLRGTAVAQQIAQNHGFSSVAVTFDGTLDWGETVTANVTVPIPVLAVPGIGTFAGSNVTLSHAERVDDYRSFPP